MGKIVGLAALIVVLGCLAVVFYRSISRPRLALTYDPGRMRWTATRRDVALFAVTIPLWVLFWEQYLINLMLFIPGIDVSVLYIAPYAFMLAVILLAHVWREPAYELAKIVSLFFIGSALVTMNLRDPLRQQGLVEGAVAEASALPTLSLIIASYTFTAVWFFWGVRVRAQRGTRVPGIPWDAYPEAAWMRQRDQVAQVQQRPRRQQTHLHPRLVSTLTNSSALDGPSAIHHPSEPFQRWHRAWQRLSASPVQGFGDQPRVGQREHHALDQALHLGAARHGQRQHHTGHGDDERQGAEPDRGPSVGEGDRARADRVGDAGRARQHRVQLRLLRPVGGASLPWALRRPGRRHHEHAEDHDQTEGGDPPGTPALDRDQDGAGTQAREASPGHPGMPNTLCRGLADRVRLPRVAPHHESGRHAHGHRRSSQQRHRYPRHHALILRARLRVTAQDRPVGPSPQGRFNRRQSRPTTMA